MKQVLLSGKGQIEVIDVPAPGRMPDSVLVRNCFSVISSGTEGAAVTKHGGVLGLYEKAIQSRERLTQVWRLFGKAGLEKTWEVVRNKLEGFTTPGYSCAGQIVELDNQSLPFHIGQTVACAGGRFACHAEYVAVPKNLVVPIPDGVSLEEASFVAIGSIALQGIRRLELTPGERVGVIGLGLIGQICVRLLDAMGYQAFGMDIKAERVAKASEIESVKAWPIDSVDSVNKINRLTDGRALDGVVVCAATTSDDPVNLAFDLCRQRGRVSIVGDTGLDLQREKMYKKEIELRLSASYGPGRYDDDYEIKGHDYPFGYVRWTERRNMAYFLDLLSKERLDVRPLVTAKFPVEEAKEAYSRIKNQNLDDYGVLFDYNFYPETTVTSRQAQRTLRLASPLIRVSNDKIHIGLIGVGGYAQGVHIPNLRKLDKHFLIHGVADRSGATASAVARKTQAAVTTTEYQELLNEKEIDAVIIATRHASHAQIVLDALDAGKHVFVEKPMATTVEDAQRIVRKASDTGLLVRVGFNRRFSPYLNEMRRSIGEDGPRIFSVRVNTGDISNHWSNSQQEGGRLIGEGVHFFDLCNWFMDSEPFSLSAQIAGEIDLTNPNASVHVRYPDGSIAQILYTAFGHDLLGKEYYEAFGNGRAVRSDDFKRFAAFGTPISVRRRARGDKGQLSELEEFAKRIRGKTCSISGADARAGLVATWMAIAAYASAQETKQMKLHV